MPYFGLLNGCVFKFILLDASFGFYSMKFYLPEKCNIIILVPLYDIIQYNKLRKHTKEIKSDILCCSKTINKMKRNSWFFVIFNSLNHLAFVKVILTIFDVNYNFKLKFHAKNSYANNFLINNLNCTTKTFSFFAIQQTNNIFILFFHHLFR